MAYASVQIPVISLEVSVAFLTSFFVLSQESYAKGSYFLGLKMFYREHDLAYVQPQILDSHQEICTFTTIKNELLWLDLEGRQATS